MNKPIDSRVYNLAANLFGNPSASKADQFCNVPKPLPRTENGIIAVFPCIVQEVFAMTMDRYRVYVGQYNFQVKAENRDNENFNSQMELRFSKVPPTPVERKLIEMFNHRTKGIAGREFNALADEFNAVNGPLIKKKRIQTVKYHTEIVFQNFLYAYNQQLMKRNEQYMRLRVYTPRPLQEFEIDSQKIASLKRNETRSLDLCKKSIRNHRDRLVECGVLMGFHFRGSQMATVAHINPKILVVLDMKTSKIAYAENQLLTLPKGKVLPDDNENTRTFINDSEIKENAVGDFPDKEFATLTPKPFVFYRNTTGKERNPPMPPPPEGVKVSEFLPPLASPAGRFAKPAGSSALVGRVIPDPPSRAPNTAPTNAPTLSDRLAARTIDPQELAEQLAHGIHERYTPIDIRALEKEAYHGTMTNEQFRLLVIQDFFRSAAKLYRNSTPYTGSWRKAIDLYHECKFKAFNGLAFGKASVLEDIGQLRWRLEHVRKYQVRNPEWKILFPNDYFDVTRSTAAEGGFEYTAKAWKTHLKSLERTAARKKKREADSEKRKRRNGAARKCNTAVRNFHRNKITLPQLLDYVERNLPAEFMQKLPELIDKLRP